MRCLFRDTWPWLTAVCLLAVGIFAEDNVVRVLGDSGSYLGGLFFRGPIYPAFLHLVLPHSVISGPLDMTGHVYRSVGIAQKAIALVVFSAFTLWLARQHRFLPLYLVGSALVGGYLVGVNVPLYFRTYLTWVMTEGLVMSWLIIVFWVLAYGLIRRSPVAYLALAPLCLFGVLLAPRLVVFSLVVFVPLSWELRRRKISPDTNALRASGLIPVLFAMLFLAASWHTYRRYRAFTPVDFSGIAFIGPTLAFLDAKDAARFEDPLERRFVQLAAASTDRLPGHRDFIGENDWELGPRLLKSAMGNGKTMPMGARVNFFSEVSGKLMRSPALLSRWGRWTLGILVGHFRHYFALTLLALVLCLPYVFLRSPTPWHALAFCAGGLHLANVLFTVPLCGVDGRYLLTSALLVPPAIGFLLEGTLATADTARKLRSAFPRSLRALLSPSPS